MTNKTYDKHTLLWAGLRWRANSICNQWFTRLGMVVSRYVDIKVWNKPG